jgi:hypothetical protein
VKDDCKYGHYESVASPSFQNQIFEGPDTDIETGNSSSFLLNGCINFTCIMEKVLYFCSVSQNCSFAMQGIPSLKMLLKMIHQAPQGGKYMKLNHLVRLQKW